LAYDLKAVLKLEDRMSAPLRKATAQLNQMDKVTKMAARGMDTLEIAAKGAATATAAMTKSYVAESQRLKNVNDAASRSFVHLSNEATKSKMSVASLSSTFKAVERSAAAALSRVSGFAGNVVGKAVTTAKYGALGVAALGGVAASRGLKLASEAEQAQIAFTTMLGSADKAQQFLADLTKFANTTPFELPQLRDASKRMLAFGFAADQVLPTLTAVGNAAAGLGLGADGIDRITLALGQMRAKSKVSGDEMLQLTEAGIPAWEILAKRMNTTTQAIMKMSEQGLIPADKAINALIDGMNEKFPRMMEQQSKSLQGLWSTMKDTFDNTLLKQFGDGIANALRPRFEALTQWINANGDTIQRWGQRLGDAASSAINRLMAQFDRGFNYIKTHYLDNPAFQALPDGMRKFEFIIEDFKKTFNAWYDASGKTEIENAVSKMVSFATDIFGAASPAFIDAGAKLGGAIGQGIWDGLRDFVAEHKALAILASTIAGTTLGARLGPYGAALGALAGFVGGTVATQKASSERRIELATELAARMDKWINKQFGLSQEQLDALKMDWSENGYIRYERLFFDALASRTGKDADELRKMATGGSDDIKSLIADIDSVPGFKSGLSRVPYDGFRAVLHKDEAVLTASEAREWRQGKGGMGGGINVSVGNITIQGSTSTREDAEKIADYIAQEIFARVGGMTNYAY
jgi:tape measure domain-containing protein